MGANLITANEYKAYAGIVSNAQDATINSIIPKVSSLVKAICRRTFIDYVDEPKVQIYSGGDSLPLKEYPILAVQSVEISSDYGATYYPMQEFVDYVLDTENDQIVPVPRSTMSPGDFPYAYQYTYHRDASPTFKKAINGYKVSYLAGYDEELPPDLKLAVMDLVTYYIRNDSAVHSTKAPGTNTVQIEYISNTHLPAHIKRVLDLYTADYL